ncbi:MAG: MiaB/RimO family radical SAM methylthiotransferase [Atopobiaceae bacterium]|nr:MiaB/RimO family radical SAM methylthiotransferase [Atopobiaceae bacterium]
MAAEMSRSPRVAYVNLGCRVNRVELDDIALALEAYGCEASAAKDADLVIVNSCAVTGEAEAKTRKAVRRAAALPQMPSIIATGCVASLWADELASLAPDVIVEPDKPQVVGRALMELGLEGLTGCAPIPSISVTPTGRTRPGVKIQDGCDCRCSFCIVWKARGRSRSVPYDEILERVRAAMARGAEEVVLTGINLGRYECEAPDGSMVGLSWLLDRLLLDTEVGRIRLSSIEPHDADDAMLKVIGGSDGRIAPFLHLPLQSGCDATLRRMRRICDSSMYAERAERAKELVPGLALCCDLIVGFPGETDGEFEESLAFCERMGFARMHVFRYSKRPGTPAAAAPDQVDPRVSASRAARMRALAERMRLDRARERVGETELCLVQDAGSAVSGGLFDVSFDPALNLRTGSLVPMRIEGCSDDAILLAQPL